MNFGPRWRFFAGYLETLADNPEMPREEAQRILDTMSATRIGSTPWWRIC